jgi:uncharacterized membrane protein YqhA
MNFVQITRERFGIVGELFEFFLTQKRWWMVPVIMVLLLMGVFMLFAQGSAIAPFLYTLF